MLRLTVRLGAPVQIGDLELRVASVDRDGLTLAIKSSSLPEEVVAQFARSPRHASRVAMSISAPSDVPIVRLEQEASVAEANAASTAPIPLELIQRALKAAK